MIIKADNCDRLKKTSPTTSKPTPQHSGHHHTEMDNGSVSFARAQMNANLEIASRAREAEPPNMALSRLARNMAYLLFKDYLKRMNQEDKEEQERGQAARAEAEETRHLQSVSVPVFVCFGLVNSIQSRC